jgi:WXG100 family type VII secretion target
MADEIKADYEQLEQVASRFSNQAQAIHEMFEKIRCSMQNLQDGWIGRGSDAFFAEMQSEVLPATQRLKDALEEAGQVTTTIIQTVQQADEEASSPFRTSL